MSGIYSDNDTYIADYTWNQGKLYEQDFNNHNPNVLYPVHSTYNNTINVDEYAANKGYIFYNTAENLPAFYTIEYATLNRNTDNVNKFLYRIDLKSEHESYTPTLDSIKFVINSREDVV